MGEDEIKVYPISEVKTLQISRQPQFILLKITSGKTAIHYSMRHTDLKKLGKQLSIDAEILNKTEQDIRPSDT